MADGEPLAFEQEPAILKPDHAGSVGLIDFAVLGDHETVVFEREDPAGAAGVVEEVWGRTGTITVGGRTISLFAPRWSRHIWSERLRYERQGFDRPHVYWGRFIVPSISDGPYSSETETRSVYLRTGSTGIPHSHVRLIAADVQFSSHVVNLLIPGFGDSRVTSGSFGFDLPTAANSFLAHFGDDYDGIAFIPQRPHMAAFGGFHRNIKNEVQGIGKPRSGPRNLDSGLSGISIVFQAAVPKPVVPKYTTSGVRRPSEL